MANNHVEKKIGILSKDNIVRLSTDCETWAMDQMALYDDSKNQSPVEVHDDYRSLVELCDSN